jgi:hypothetical protein
MDWMIQEVVLVALTSTEEVTYILDYKESMLMHLEELPHRCPNQKNRKWMIFIVHSWLKLGRGADGHQSSALKSDRV